MSEIFKEKYAQLYDLIYTEKNYEKECDFIEEIFKWFKVPIRSVVDFGCGTGRHLAILKKRSYDVFGVDKAESMAIEARKRGLDIQIGDFSKMNFNRIFDSCISMFDVISYLISTNECLEVMHKIRSILHKGSPFIFQFRYGPAILHQKPITTTKSFPGGLRVSDFKLRTSQNLYDIFIKIIKNGKIEVEETHSMRYFFPDEIKKYLEDAGFRILTICPLFKPYVGVTEEDFSAIAIAKVI